MRVVVVGSAGRMGSAVCRAVDADQDLELAAAVDPSSAGSEDPTGTVNVVEGGLQIPNDAGTDSTLIAHAAAVVRLDLD